MVKTHNLIPNTSTTLQAIPAAETNLAEGRFLRVEQSLNEVKSLPYRAETGGPTVSKRERQALEPR
jgi:hypothetical protein